MTGLKVWYDREGDVLEVIFDESPATFEEMEEDVFERRTADGRITGFMVLNFSRHDQNGLILPLAVSAIAVA